jgi:hypothetical protein
MEAALWEAYRQALHVRIRQAIDVITQHISQRRLELLIGLS